MTAENLQIWQIYCRRPIHHPLHIHVDDLLYSTRSVVKPVEILSLKLHRKMRLCLHGRPSSAEVALSSVGPGPGA